MSLNLHVCDRTCINCVKHYKNKHSLIAGQPFEIRCNGIRPPDTQLALLPSFNSEDSDAALSILDPVAWAADTLDWHCLDPDGEIWKRKNPDEYNEWIAAHPGIPIQNHSRFHRPYQATMLRCSSKRKVFRIGRQCGKTEALVISILYSMFTKPGLGEQEGFKVIVLTPYQSQIDLIFKRLEELLHSNPYAANSIKRSVKAPNYTISLYNGSEVKGFTAGTKSGGNADAVRGQAAHMLVFDEADYLSPSDMDSALSIIINHPQATLWMSSTPSGKREKFYQTCYSKQFREFHYPSHINPMFSGAVDTLFKEQLTSIGYKHEILAEFGEQEEGVFQNVYIQAAKLDYQYREQSYQNGWTYMMGVDWNDVKNGTTIAVLGFDPHHNWFTIVGTEIVSREGWTQLSACQKIAELNRVWHPTAIYIDSGFGGTQWEVLRKYGYDSTIDPNKGPNHPDAKLKDIVKKFEFGSKVEVRDLWTHIPIQKPAKPFLVESTVRRFESQDIKFSKHDTVLERQLAGYIIDRVTPSGQPVYRALDPQIGDHLLDAVMLAVVGFVLEVSPLGRATYTSNIMFSGRIGERIDPPIFTGDTVIKSDRKKDNVRDKVKPSMKRTDVLERHSLLGTERELPGANMATQGQLALWNWPGFMRDQERPRIRSLSEAEGQARQKMGFGVSLGSRPQRKNI